MKKGRMKISRDQGCNLILMVTLWLQIVQKNPTAVLINQGLFCLAIIILFEKKKIDKNM